MQFVIYLLVVTIVGCHGEIDNVVGIHQLKYNQIVTSSTLKWIATSGGRVPDNAVQGATIRMNTEDEEVEHPVWVCRARADALWVAGWLTITGNERHSGKCVVSMHGAVTYHEHYEILQNIEEGGKLSWMHWDKYNMPPGGAVSACAEPLTYIARRKTKSPTSTVDYHLGRLDTNSGLLGKIFIVEDGVEREYYDGEILVETEPIKYEMKKVKFNMFRARYNRDPVILGKIILRNEDTPENDGYSEDLSRVDSVIAYRYNQTVSWGHGHAILTGLNVSIQLENGTQMDNFVWGTDVFKSGEATYPVEAFLAPGRGVNVTLSGTWTESTIPYNAMVFNIYPDGSNKSRPIVGIRKEIGLRDVLQELGPVFYLHNNSFVPTTTTTTTQSTTIKTSPTTPSTTSTSSRTSTSTSTEEARPIPASPMEEMNSTTKKGDLADPSRKRENQSMQSDSPKSESSSKPSHSTHLQIIPLILLLGILMTLLST